MAKVFRITNIVIPQTPYTIKQWILCVHMCVIAVIKWVVMSTFRWQDVDEGQSMAHCLTLCCCSWPRCVCLVFHSNCVPVMWCSFTYRLLWLNSSRIKQTFSLEKRTGWHLSILLVITTTGTVLVSTPGRCLQTTPSSCLLILLTSYYLRGHHTTPLLHWCHWPLWQIKLASRCL